MTNRYNQFVQQWQQRGQAAARAFVARMESIKPLHHYSSVELCEYQAARQVASI